VNRACVGLPAQGGVILSKNSMTRIYLDRSRSPRAFDGAESLWAEDLFRVLRLIGQHVQQLDGSTEEGDCRGKPGANPRQSNVHSEEDEPFLSIAIFGPSGSGKSSLLSTLVREVQLSRQATGGFFHDHGVLSHLDSGDPFYGQRDTVKDLHCKMATLKVLHPDTFAQDDNFLYAVLARALEEEKRVNDKKRATAEPDVLSALQRRFQELSDFLRVLDPVERSQDYDPLGLSLERMERHTSGLLLRDKLKDFLGQLPNSLGVSKGGIVLLPVDDVDMSPEHMVEILQIYQSFLLHPRVVPVFTFTDRTAEELLNVHFSKYLSRNSETFDEPGEGGNRLRVSEKLALQHLARCFPVRNRIRLGPAPARVQKANYLRSFCEVSKSNSDGTPVLDLLRAANFLLFGHPDWDKTHEVRAALRPSTLRRQLHVMDTLVEAGVENYAELFQESIFSHKPNKQADTAEEENKETPKQLKPDPKKKKDHWVRILNRSTWALLNVHRDVLREFDLYVEDLYSWSARALRRVVLDTLLALDVDVRRALLRRWRDRSDSRRSQVLSLLAMTVFKPWTPVEEPYGDDEYLYTRPKELGDGAEEQAKVEGNQGLYTNTALLWFLELTMGFYMPLALARPRDNDILQTDSARSRNIGIGWNVESGPVNAIRDADARQNMLPTGICFLNPERFGEALDPEGSERIPDASHLRAQAQKTLGAHQTNELTIRLWCFYGYSQGRFWSAASFWRGLGLLARIMDRHRRYRYEFSTADAKESGNRTAQELNETRSDQWRKRLRSLLRHHLVRGLVPVGMLGKISNERQFKNITFKPWDCWNKVDGDRDVVDLLVEELMAWLGSDNWDVGASGSAWENRLLYPLPTNGKRVGWRQSFMRRFHGEDILGDFHLRLATTYIEQQEEYLDENKRFVLSVGAALLSWTGVLLEHWRGVYSVQRLLRSCPLLRGFVRGPAADELRFKLLTRKYKELHSYADKGIFSELVDEDADGNDANGKMPVDKFVERYGNPLNSTLEEATKEKVLRVSSIALAHLTCRRLRAWKAQMAQSWPEYENELQGRLYESLSAHWHKIGPLPGQEEDFITSNAPDLFKDQLRELYWANQEILTVRWLWDLKRVDWKNFEAQKEEEWIRASVEYMVAPGEPDPPSEPQQDDESGEDSSPSETEGEERSLPNGGDAQ
jgi:RecA/RadA recombinase